MYYSTNKVNLIYKKGVLTSKYIPTMMATTYFISILISHILLFLAQNEILSILKKLSEITRKML